MEKGAEEKQEFSLSLDVESVAKLSKVGDSSGGESDECAPTNEDLKPNAMKSDESKAIVIHLDSPKIALNF